MSLITAPNLADPDAAYATLLAAHKGLTEVQSEILAAALKAAGASVEFETLQGAGHGGPKFQTPENLQRVRSFFDRHLRP